MKINSLLSCLASCPRMNLKKPLKAKLATDSPGWILEEITMTFLHFKGYFLFGQAVTVIIGTGSPKIELQSICLS